jgi:phosphoenolpyruvate carboxylase
VTLEVSLRSRITAAKLFLSDVAHLKRELSMCYCSEELRSYVSEKDREPYRAVLQEVEGRLQATVEEAEAHLAGGGKRGKKQAEEAGDAGYANSGPFRRSDELLQPLLMIHRSLLETGLADVAGGSITDTIRRAVTFGLSLLLLDLRQESSRHSEVLDAITKHLGVGSYLQWDEQKRRDWLLEELKSRRPLLPRNFNPEQYSATVVDTLNTFHVAATLGQESLGAYVISHCQQASDILAVMLLQKDAGVEPALRVVPLFETLDDLQRSEVTIEALFKVCSTLSCWTRLLPVNCSCPLFLQMPLYKELIKGKQEIMVGYSDSAKVRRALFDESFTSLSAGLV